MEADSDACREVDLREELRLQLVGVACELATLEARIVEEAGAAGEAAQALIAEGTGLAAKARAVLSPTTDFDAVSEDALRAALAVLQGEALEMRRLREALSQLPGETPDFEVAR